MDVVFIDLDHLHCEADWVEAPDAVFRERTHQAVAVDSWVVAVNYSQVRDIVWPRADTLVWPDYSFVVVFSRMIRRTVRRVVKKEILFAGNVEDAWMHLKVWSKESLINWVITTHARRRREFASAVVHTARVRAHEGIAAMEAQTLYQVAIKFATSKHLEKEQKIPGTDHPYVVHLSNVAMEILVASAHTDDFEVGFAVQVALLHDTMEDTSATLDELTNMFGGAIASAVSALTKNKILPKEQQMQDSLQRIKKMQKEVWAVKLADRITNLQPPPPPHWSQEKVNKYRDEARTIHSELQDGNEFLASRLNACIEVYGM